MLAADAKHAARLHAEHLPHGLFPKLGTRFLWRYYNTFHASPHAVALATGAPGSPVGILVGVLAPHDHYEWVIRHQGVRLAFAGLGALLLRPWLLGGFIRQRLPRYLKALRSLLRAQSRTGEPATPSSSPQDQPIGVLSHIVVARATQRGGAGASLVEAFLAEALRAGLMRARATTLDGPDGAARFYERTGWQRRTSSQNWDGQRIVLFERSTKVNVGTK